MTYDVSQPSDGWQWRHGSGQPPPLLYSWAGCQTGRGGSCRSDADCLQLLIDPRCGVIYRTVGSGRGPRRLTSQPRPPKGPPEQSKAKWTRETMAVRGSSLHTFPVNRKDGSVVWSPCSLKDAVWHTEITWCLDVKRCLLCCCQAETQDYFDTVFTFSECISSVWHFVCGFG